VLQHLEELPFETAASIAGRVGGSPMTAGRFIRKLGYRDLRESKPVLRTGSAESGMLSRQITRKLFDNAPLESKIKALSGVHRLPSCAEWPGIVALLSTARHVHVANFQLDRFIGIAQSLLELLLVDVAKQCKGRAQRYEAIHQLREKFVGFEKINESDAEEA
jgi:DNA-binding MurR/RpiR family transcriptional regulator